MKTKSLLFTFFVSALVAFNLNVVADGHEGGDHGGDSPGDHQSGGGDNQEDGPQGGQIDGSESLEAKVVLVATTNAPSGAGGFASLEAQDTNGIVTATLSVKTVGLVAGDYTLSVVKKSDGSTVVLGTITIGASTNSGDLEDEQGDGEHSGGDHHGNEGGCGTVLSESDVQLPAGLDPLDIAQIVLSDASGNALLVGDLVNPTKASVVKFKASLKVKSGSLGSQVSGRAQAVSTVSKGKRTDRFTMIASGVSANTSFSVHINGARPRQQRATRRARCSSTSCRRIY